MQILFWTTIVLRKAGYDPSPFWDDPYYPEDLQAAQRLVDYWYRTNARQHKRSDR